MRLARNVSRHGLAARWSVAVILVAGIALRSAPQAVALASIAYFAVAGHRVQWVAGRCGTSVSELVASSGLLVRRGSLWVLVGLAAVFNLLLWGEFTLTIISVAFLYAAGLFAQAARLAEDERQLGDEDERRPGGEEERRPEANRRPSGTEPGGE